MGICAGGCRRREASSLDSAAQNRIGNSLKRPRDELPSSEITRPATKVRRVTLSFGRVKRLMPSRDPPFGFIAPESGGGDLFFNERLLGDGKTWGEFLHLAKAHEFAPVVFVLSDGHNGRPQAKGVVVLHEGDVHMLDSERRGQLTARELARFWASHPKLEQALLIQQERDSQRRAEEWQHLHDSNEEKSLLRSKLFQKQQGAEDALYKKRDEEHAKAMALRDEAQKLWEAAQRVREDGQHQHQRASAMQDQAKSLQAEAKINDLQARSFKEEAVALDWKHNEEMFEHVQGTENRQRARDGTWVDLHGLSVDFAEHKVLEFLSSAREKHIRQAEIITGAGRHSGKDGPVIKHRIEALLRKPPRRLEGLRFDHGSDGSVNIYL